MTENEANPLGAPAPGQGLSEAREETLSELLARSPRTYTPADRRKIVEQLRANAERHAKAQMEPKAKTSRKAKAPEEKMTIGEAIELGDDIL